MIYLFSNTAFQNTDNIKHIQTIDINFLPFDYPDKTYDAIIFTSKNSVRAMKKKTDKWLKIPSYCIGKASADEVLFHGGLVEFISQSSHGDKFALEIEKILLGKKVLYPHAKKVVSDLKALLANIAIDELIVYETTCNPNVKNLQIPMDATLIFTSPSSVECFLNFHKLKSTQKIICIGYKTAQALPKNINFTISPEQSISSCVKIAQNL